MAKEELKIGIVTFHEAWNYGAVLQCYALKNYLRSVCAARGLEGAEVFVAKSGGRHPYLAGYRLYYFHRSGERPLWRDLISAAAGFFYVGQKSRVKKAFTDFCKNELSPVRPVSAGFDALVYGSDQIWNLELTKGDLFFFGENFRGIKVAYGASAGGEIERLQNESGLLGEYSAISCREKTLSQKVSAITRKSAATVCDPVFLLSKDEWLSLSERGGKRSAKTLASLPPRYILCYLIAPREDFDAQAARLSATLGVPLVRVVYVKSLKRLFIKDVYKKTLCAVRPQEFVSLFSRAEFVLTTSFHGTAFSLIFQKPFAVLQSDKKDAMLRLRDLLFECGLSSRITDDVSKIDASLSSAAVFTGEANQKLSEYIERSKRWLSETLVASLQERPDAVAARIPTGGGYNRS